MTPTPMLDKAAVALTHKLIDAINTTVLGQPEAVDLLVCTLLGGGHLLIEDVPGVGKTTMVRSLAAAMKGTFARIQFTSDLLPTDLLGVSVYNKNDGSFTFKKGPIFANLVLADEVNRASPKTQSALLEAMSEQQVTTDGATRRLDPPFMVVATQNSTEHYGTYPLPESQLDRFAISIRLGYPAPDIETAIISRPQMDPDWPSPVVTTDQVAVLQQQIATIFMDPHLNDYIMALVQATRTHKEVALGISTRGGMTLHRCARALAFIKGRPFVLPDDIQHLATPVLAHRLVLHHSGQTDRDRACEIIKEVVAHTTVPV